jgi:serine protease AprX
VAALWWPETATQAHNDIDVYLIDPSGAVRAGSWSIPTVFERARVDGALNNGTWKLRIRGYSVPTGSQTVYWAAHVRLR